MSSPISPGGGDRRRLLLLYPALGLLVLTPLILWPGRYYGGASKLLNIVRGSTISLQDQAAGLVMIANVYYDTQYTILLVVTSLMLLYAYKLFPILWSLARSGMAGMWITSELMFLFWLVYGGLSGMGMPGLFWNPSFWPQFTAGFGVTMFVYWMLYLAYVLNASNHRGHPEQLIWTRFEPVLVDSGLPALLGHDPARQGSVARLGWFLGYTGLPALIALALPAVLPAVRPGDVARVVAVPWLLGEATGALTITAVVRGRMAHRFHAVWRQLRNRRLNLRQVLTLEHEGLYPHANVTNVLVILGIVFLGSYLMSEPMIRLMPPAFSICFLLGVLATLVVWVGTWSFRTKSVVGLVVLVLVAMAGVLDFEVVLRDLSQSQGSPTTTDLYPGTMSQLLRRMDPDGVPPADYANVVCNLAEFQKQYNAKDHDRARLDRELLLENWAQSFSDRKERVTTRVKPILVVVTTSGGALRASLWTQTVLKSLDQTLPDFHHHLRLITGASGGMLGAAHYVASYADGKVPDTRELRSDYLSPIAWQIAFRDIFPNSIIPFATYNRGDTLEDEWVKHSPGLGKTFTDLKPQEDQGLIPSIVFSPMLVEDGRRLLISNLPLADLTSNRGFGLINVKRQTLIENYRQHHSLDRVSTPDDYDLEFPDLASVSALEFFRLLGEKTRSRLRLASAVRMSATFPFVTSVVTIPTFPPRHVVDAGYYDNYGINLAASWIASHADWLKENTAGVLVIQIRAFRNERRLKVLDEAVHAATKPTVPRNMMNGLKAQLIQFVRMVPGSAALLLEGIQSLVIPVEGVATARESSMFFRNDEQLIFLHRVFTKITDGDEGFFRSVIFSCDTLQTGRSTQNVETLNWFIEEDERHQIEKNMDEYDKVEETGRNRNFHRLQEVKEWWNSRK